MQIVFHAGREIILDFESADTRSALKIADFVWELMLPEITSVCRAYSTPRTPLDETLSEVYSQFANVIANWEPTRGDLFRCVKSQVRWRAFKYRRREHMQQARCAELPVDLSQAEIDPDDAIEVDDIVRALVRDLGPCYADVLTYHFMQGFWYEEIGDALGISKTSAYNLCERALNHAKSFAVPVASCDAQQCASVAEPCAVH